MSVHLPDINIARFPRKDIGDCLFQGERDLQGLGEVIKRAQRKNPQRHIGPHQFRSYGAYCSVAAAPHDDFRAFRARCSHKMCNVPAFRHEVYLRVGTVVSRDPSNRFRHCNGIAGARFPVQDETQAQGSVGHRPVAPH